MSERDLAALREVNVSMGIMLESTSERLLAPGAAHDRAPDKVPARRLRTIALAGQARHPLHHRHPDRHRRDPRRARRRRSSRSATCTSATATSRRSSSRTSGPSRTIPMRGWPDPGAEDLLRTVAVARLLLGPAMNIQAPPNLSADGYERLAAAGLNDWGGVSPLTPDHINPERPWPGLAELRRAHRVGRPRAARAPGGLSRVRDARPTFLDERLRARVGAPDRRRRPRETRSREVETLVSDDDPTPITLDWASSRRPPHPRRSPRRRRAVGRRRHPRSPRSHGRDLQALTLVADEMRRRQAGDVVTYVVNRNINFTNVCIKHCTFCAFSRDHREEEGYFLPMDEVVRRAIEAWEMGATEVCIQAGLPPEARRLATTSISAAPSRRRCPRCTCTPSRRRRSCTARRAPGLPIPEYLAALKKAGLGTLPGTSAEMLDQEIRDLIARGRITVEQWIEVITSAHAPGHPHHLHHHVRARRAARPLDPPHGPAAPHPEGHRRLHRVRAPVADPPGGADVPARARARRPAGRDRPRGRQDARARAPLPGPHSSATSSPRG